MIPATLGRLSHALTQHLSRFTPQESLPLAWLAIIPGIRTLCLQPSSPVRQLVDDTLRSIMSLSFIDGRTHHCHHMLFQRPDLVCMLEASPMLEWQWVGPDPCIELLCCTATDEPLVLQHNFCDREAVMSQPCILEGCDSKGWIHGPNNALCHLAHRSYAEQCAHKMAAQLPSICEHLLKEIMCFSACAQICTCTTLVIRCLVSLNRCFIQEPEKLETEGCAEMASGISMHAYPLASSLGRRITPAVSCSSRPNLPQVGLCLVREQGLVMEA